MVALYQAFIPVYELLYIIPAWQEVALLFVAPIMRKHQVPRLIMEQVCPRNDVVHVYGIRFQRLTTVKALACKRQALFYTVR